MAGRLADLLRPQNDLALHQDCCNCATVPLWSAAHREPDHPKMAKPVITARTGSFFGTFVSGAASINRMFALMTTSGRPAEK